MAIILSGSSTCSICGEILQKSNDIIGWTAFLNKEHKLWKYSDSGMHRICFENWGHKNKFEELYKYQPQINFDDPCLKKLITEHGMPDWLKAIKDYRMNKNSLD